MEKTFSLVTALVLTLGTAVALANPPTTTTTDANNDQKREVASDFSKDYLEQVKDEKAAELTKEQKQAKDHIKYLQSLKGREDL